MESGYFWSESPKISQDIPRLGMASSCCLNLRLDMASLLLLGQETRGKGSQGGAKGN